MSQTCPNCSLLNPDSALRCDCGFDFESSTLKKSYLHAEHEEKVSSKRPLVLTILCIIGFLGAFVVLPGLVSTEIRSQMQKQYGSSSVFVAGGAAVAGLIALVGYWKMRKWGVYLYTVLFMVNLVYSIIAGIPFLTVYSILPILIIIVGFAHLRKME